VCSNNKCTASILTNSTKKLLIIKDSVSIDNHSDIPTSTIERQVVRENCKRKVVDCISTKPNKIIRTELLTDNYSTPCHKDFINIVRKTIYTAEEENILHHFLSHLMKHLLNLRQIKTV